MSPLRPKFCLNYLSAASQKVSTLSSQKRKISRHSPPRQFFKAAILWAFVACGIGVAPDNAFATVRQVCYAVGDNGGNGDPDFFIQVADDGTVIDIGATGTNGIEAAAVDPVNGEYFVADDTGAGSILGTINLATGAFTARPGATAVAGDIDGLSFTPGGRLFASTRVAGGGNQDQLFELNPANGAVISGPTNIDTSALSGLDDIDGITFDPTGTTLFGIANSSATSDQRLIQIDTTNGNVTDIGSFTVGGNPIEDVEDLTFDRLGNLRATTGNGSGSDDDELYIVDPTTGNSTFVSNITSTNAIDFEASDCARLPAIDLALAKAVSPASAAPGDTVTFTIAVQNGFVATGPTPAPNNSNLSSAADNANLDPANNVTITDVLPAGLTISGTTAPVASEGTFDSGTGVWTLGTIAPGERETLTITATVDGGTAAGTLTNFAQVTTDRVAGGLADIAFFPGTDPYDIDSLPGNDTGNTPDEDDEATADLTITAPTGVNVGNFVFEDLDGDGIQDIGEPGIAGVELALLNAADGSAVTGVANVTSAATTGAYNFANVPAGDYIIRAVNLPAGGFVPTLEDQGAGATQDETDSDLLTVGANFQTASFTVATADDETRDLGFVRPTSVGDFIFQDTNRNGIQDAGETAGVTGAVVTLIDANTGNPVAGVTPITTVAGGAYTFTDVPPGDYRVRFDISGITGAEFTIANATGSNTTNDSDAVTQITPGVFESSNVTLTSGDAANLDLDAGVIGASLGNFVFLDSNSNGIQDGGESGVAGVTATLQNAGGGAVTDIFGNAVAPVSTAGDGLYQFNNLLPGSYEVVFDATATGFDFTTQNATGSDDTNDSDVNGTNGISDAVTLAAGELNDTLDAGLIGNGLGDFVFIDSNGNGLQDVGEPGVAGVVVTLQDSAGATVNDASGNPVGPITTTSTGAYNFSNLNAGNYQILFDATTTGLTFIAPDAGDDSLDSDVVPDAGSRTGSITGITLGANATNLTLDAGLRGATIGDRVFNDLNTNGIDDAGDTGASGVTVSIQTPGGGAVTDASGNTVGPVVTDPNGNYSFENLSPGDYQVVFTGVSLAPQGNGSNPGADSNPDPATGVTPTITLAPGQTEDLTIDAGVVGASLGSLVFVDTNNNGVRDPGEDGQAGVTVTLQDENGNPVTDLSGNPVAPITTGADGAYSFTNLAPGNYQVLFDPGTTGLVFSAPNVGGDDTVDSDVDPTTGLITGITLTAGENRLNADAGVSPAPQLTLVKRITGVSRNGAALAVANFAGVELDNPSLGDAPLTATTLAQFEAAGLSPVGVQQISDTNQLLPGDEVEYTIYFISSGLGTVGNAELCDVLTDRLDFNEAGGISLTGSADSSAFLSGLSAVPTSTQAGRSCNVSQLGDQGAVVAELGDLAPDEVGSVTFSTFIDGEQ